MKDLKEPEVLVADTPVEVYHTNSLVSIAFFALALSFGILFIFNLLRGIKAWKVRKNA